MKNEFTTTLGANLVQDEDNLVKTRCVISLLWGRNAGVPFGAKPRQIMEYPKSCHVTPI